MSDVKRFEIIPHLGTMARTHDGPYVLYTDWATERQAREKAEAERDAGRQKSRELVEALLPFSHPDLGKQSTSAMADDAIVFGRDKALLRRSDFNKVAAILARHKEA